MKRLYVGCRVRILWSHGWPEIAGKTGVIVGLHGAPVLRGDKCDWRVKPDCWPSERAPYEGYLGERIFAPSSDQLEPIQDDGHRVISWEEMKGLWTPSNIAEGTPE